jgi:uncharacterized protein YndB with AHSA1/START domain
MNQLDTTFSALADPTRRAILAQLALGERTVGELAEPFDISLPAISRHLRVLESASLIVTERRGKYLVRRLNASALADATEWLEFYRTFWSEGFDRLEAHLKKTKGVSMPPQANVDTPSIEISRYLDAPAEQVFDAWVSKDFGAWLPLPDAVRQTAVIEPRVGGCYELSMTMNDGRTIDISGVYREIVRPHKLVMTWVANYIGQETLLTLTFQPQGTGTLMKLRHDGVPTALRDNHKANWMETLNRLATYLKDS